MVETGSSRTGSSLGSFPAIPSLYTAIGTWRTGLPLFMLVRSWAFQHGPRLSWVAGRSRANTRPLRCLIGAIQQLWGTAGRTLCLAFDEQSYDTFACEGSAHLLFRSSLICYRQWLRLDALALNLVWVTPFLSATRGNVGDAWKLAGIFVRSSEACSAPMNLRYLCRSQFRLVGQLETSR